MVLTLRTLYKVGDKVKFRQASPGIAKHHLPSGIIGTVKSAYLEPYGVSLREHLDIEFQTPSESSRSAQPNSLELHSIAADEVEKV